MANLTYLAKNELLPLLLVKEDVQQWQVPDVKGNLWAC